MANVLVNAEYGIDNKHFKIILTLLEFEEDGVTIIYSPALDVSGYGKTIEDARASFELSLEQFLLYSNNKNTLEKQLQKMGWNILGSKKKPKFEPPKNSELATKNPFYSEILDSKNYKSYNEPIELAY